MNNFMNEFKNLNACIESVPSMLPSVDRLRASPPMAPTVQTAKRVEEARCRADIFKSIVSCQMSRHEGKQGLPFHRRQDSSSLCVRCGTRVGVRGARPDSKRLSLLPWPTRPPVSPLTCGMMATPVGHLLPFPRRSPTFSIAYPQPPGNDRGCVSTAS